MYTIFVNGEGQGYTILPVMIRCLCVGKNRVRLCWSFAPLDFS
jgi:hypothetical protein